MEVTYKWSVGFTNAKPAFTDKHGNLRENVIKSVELIFSGVKDEGLETEKKESKSVIVNFELFDLSSFEPHNTLNKETVMTWALNTLHPVQKTQIEDWVKNIFERNAESNVVSLELQD